MKPSKDEDDEYDEFEYNDNASFPPPPIHITEPDTDEYKVFDADDGFQIGGLKEKKNKKTVVCTTEGRDLRTRKVLYWRRINFKAKSLLKRYVRYHMWYHMLSKGLDRRPLSYVP